jgi:hypothetical protein
VPAFCTVRLKRHYIFVTDTHRLVRLTTSLTIPFLTVGNGTTLFVDPAADYIEIRVKCLYVLGMHVFGALLRDFHVRSR